MVFIMGILSGIKSLFSASNSIENIAKEWIQTDIEKQEAKAVIIKTLDPNGLMRRDLSRKISALYILYVIVTLILLILESFGVGGANKDGVLFVSIATSKVINLFSDITMLFGVIVTASFGVNYANVKSESRK